jgi:hypothetical protein
MRSTAAEETAVRPMTSCWIRCCIARLVFVFMLCGLGSADAATTDETIQCYKTFSSTYFCDTFGNCSMKFKLAPILHQLTNRCVREAVKCQFVGEAGSDPSKCLAKADNRCAHVLEKLQELAIGKFAAQREQIAVDCSSVDFADDVLAVEGGMGFAANEQTCSALGIPLSSIDDLVACSDAWLHCAVEKLIALVTPRADEALTAAGWDSTFAASECMEPALPGNTAGMDYKDLHRCQSRLMKFGRHFVRESMVAVEDCIDQLLICELEGQPDCSDARSFCIHRIERIDSLQSKFERKSGRRCDDQSISELRNGLGLAESGHACAGASSPAELIQCLGAELRCSFDGIVSFLKPRAAELLTDQDLIDHFACMP